jgi:VRR-NUC domain
MTDTHQATPLTEGELLRKLMIDGSSRGLRLFRNQVGHYELKDGRRLTSGLCVGSSDLIGYLPVVVTQAMVGRTIAVFVALEVKGPRGNVRPEQKQFVDVCRGHGALAAIVRTLEDAWAALAAFRA